MQPEPSHRTTKKRKRAPNERPPICFRPGDLRGELDARCDGTEAGYRAVVVRDLQRYYRLIEAETDDTLPVNTIDVARSHYENIITKKREVVWPDDIGWRLVYLVVTDACERAKILVDNAGLTVDAALVAVGLVREGE
jgi:hypothetical protein